MLVTEIKIHKKTFDDIVVGQTWASAARTITETDIVQFAGISGDFNPLHMDAEFAKTTLFGQRIAHGLLGLSISSGLESAENWKIMAFMSLDWKFAKPIFIGDTVHCQSVVTHKKELAQKDRGIVKLERKLLNQRGEVTQEGTYTLLVERKA